jgi:transcriptional regulator with XRE-family HTH domain
LQIATIYLQRSIHEENFHIKKIIANIDKILKIAYYNMEIFIPNRNTSKGKTMPNIGLRIRELRQQRGQTLEQVATETGLSVSFLSMLERDKVSISVDNLERLAGYFKVHMVHFFRAESASPVQITRREDILQSLKLTGQGPAAVTLLSNRPDARMEPLLVAIAPGNEEPHFRQHEADVLLYVLEGEAILISETGEEIQLHQGDMAYYVNVPHRRLSNPQKDKHLLLIAITSPQTSSLDDLVQARQGAWVMSESK